MSSKASSLPALKNWNSTRDALHQGMQVMRSVSVLGKDSVPNQLEYGSFPASFGATTGPLNFGGELNYDFTNLKFVYKKEEKEIFSVSLEGKNQIGIFDEVFQNFSDKGINLKPDKEKVVESTLFKINKKLAKDYAEVQYRVFRAMSVFRSRLNGYQSPIVLWPHGFDLSFIWFTDKKGFDEKEHKHMNFGFSPGAKNQRPYLYFYAWPVPEGLVGSKLPAKGRWIEEWSTPGAAFDYDYLSKLDNPEEEITKILTSVYRNFSPRL